jgi:ankyrin repeat protein
MRAAGAGNTAVVRLLMASGAEVNARSIDCEFLRLHGSPRRGTTPVMYAAMGGNHEAVRVLLEHVAELNAVDSGSNSAWSYAADRGLHMLEIILA